MHQNPFSARAPPRTPLGSLRRSPRPLVGWQGGYPLPILLPTRRLRRVSNSAPTVGSQAPINTKSWLRHAVAVGLFFQAENAPKQFSTETPPQSLLVMGGYDVSIVDWWSGPSIHTHLDAFGVSITGPRFLPLQYKFLAMPLICESFYCTLYC